MRWSWKTGCTPWKPSIPATSTSSCWTSTCPGLDGLETAKRIRDGEGGQFHAGTIILALTGFSGDHDKQSCLDAGMDGLLGKPLDMHALAPWLAKALSKSNG